MIGFADDAWNAIQALFDDPSRGILAERLDEMLDVLESDPGDRQVRRQRMQVPGLWYFAVAGNDEVWGVLWEPDGSGEPYVHFAGPGLS